MTPEFAFLAILAVGAVTVPFVYFEARPADVYHMMRASNLNSPKDSSSVSYGGDGSASPRGLREGPSYGGDGARSWSGQSLVAAEIKAPREPKPVPREMRRHHEELLKQLG